MLLPSEIQDHARAQAIKCMEVANEHYGTNYDVPTVLFNLRGHVAGTACVDEWRVRINADLLLSHSTEQIQVTLPHEIAHLLAYRLHGPRIRAHGYQWATIMTDLFHLPPDRTHNMKTKAARRVPRYPAYCGCPSGHPITEILAKRIARGRVYTCRKCHQYISLTPREPVKPASFADLLGAIK